MNPKQLNEEAEPGQESPKFARRSFFQKMARGAVISFAGWMAARGVNVLWAEDIAAGAKPEKLGSPTGKPVQLAQNSHNDSHSDNHGDSHNDTTSPHTDVQKPTWHVDTGDIHMDYTLDFHTDTHSDS